MNFKQLFFVILLSCKFAFGAESDQILEGSGLFQRARNKFNACMEQVATNVVGILTLPTILEIMEFYKQNSICPEGLEPNLFKGYLQQEFKDRVVGQELKDIAEYHKQDQHGITSKFGLELQREAVTKTKTLQNEVLNFKIAPFFLSDLLGYQNIVAEMRQDHPKIKFDDKLLCFASHLFHVIPWGKRQFFSTDVLKKSAIGQIYKEFNDFFEQTIAAKLSSDEQKNERYEIFLAVIQNLLLNNKLQDFYKVIPTNEMIDFRVNEKVFRRVIPEIVNMYKTLNLQKKLEVNLPKGLEQLTCLDGQVNDSLKENFDRKAAIWQKSYEQLNSNWDAEYKKAHDVLESEKLSFGIAWQEYQEWLLKLKKTDQSFDKEYAELLALEQRNYAKILETYKTEFELFVKKVQKRMLEKLRHQANQVLQDHERLLQNYQDQMQVCEQEFEIELNKIKKMADVYKQNELIAQRIEHHKKTRIQNGLELEQKDILLTAIYWSEFEQLMNNRELELEKFTQNAEKSKQEAQTCEKKRVSRNVVQRFMQLMLQQRKIAREELASIKNNVTLEALQKNQLLTDLNAPKTPKMPLLPPRQISRPGLRKNDDIAEIHEITVRHPEQPVALQIRQHDPYSGLSLLPSDDERYPLDSDRSSNSSVDTPKIKSIGSFACADGFELYNRGHYNGYCWAQDQDGGWYYLNPADQVWYPA